MADTVEKVYCTDSSSALNPMLSALLTNQNHGTDAATLAMMQNGGMNSWNNNPFVYLVWMMMMRYMGGWDGNGGGAENFNSRQIATLQDTVANNHNNDLVMQAMSNNQSAIRELAQTFNTDIGNIQTAIGGVQSAIQQVGGQVGMSGQQVINSVLLGNKDIIQQMCSCCCENKLLTQSMGYETQLRDQSNTAAITARIDQLANGVQTGFAQVGYATQAQTNDILTAANANTQRIIDQLNTHWQNETALALQDAKTQVSQLQQTQTLLNAINGGCQCNS